MTKEKSGPRQRDEANDLPTASAYLREAAGLVASLLVGQEQAFGSAVDALVQCIADDGLIYLFGSGHSHMMAEEGHYRAGGLACVVPILASAIMVHEGAVAGTQMERTRGLADVLLARYPIGSGDVVIVFSTSGINAVPVEAAKAASAAGATVIGITSEAYSRRVAEGRERLADAADIVIDNRVPPGDAAITLAPGSLSAGPISTVVGAAILNALLVEAAARTMAAGKDVPIYVSANMPGGRERNAALVARYRHRNRHL